MSIAKIQEKFKEVDFQVKEWIKKQSPPVEIAIVTAASGLQGGFIGALMGTVSADLANSVNQANVAANPDVSSTMKQMKAITGGPLVQARNFAVMTGVNAGITCAMKRARGGVEDVKTSMSAAFGSGIAFSLVSGVGGQNPAMNAISTGVAFALLQGGIYKLGTMFSPPVEDYQYANTKHMLEALGLEKYEKNFKKGLLNDSTLPLLNDSALLEVRIPPGPRLLILDHIKRAPRHAK